jgi:hypothetical protein
MAMNRRKFLTGTVSGAAAAAGLAATGIAQGGQAPAGAPPAGAGQGAGRGGAGGAGGGGRGRGGSPANVSAAKLARIEIMTLNHSYMIKLPWQEATPERTLDIFELGRFYVEAYGVKDVQFQSNHIAQNNDQPDLEYIKQLKASLDKAGARANQINIEIGTMATWPAGQAKAAALAGEARAAWLARAKKWVDLAPVLGVKVLMHNQGTLNDDSKDGFIALWKEIQDYARPKGIMISGETRGSGAPSPQPARGQGAPATPPAAPAPPKPQAPMTAQQRQERLRMVYGLLVECTNAANAYTNLDFGGETRFLNQEELHGAIKAMLPRNSGGMHTRVSPTWDLGTAIRYAESIGYKGRYAIEVNQDAAVRQIYSAILGALPG